MSYFASEYTIHFDDTMAYGSHHFLTAFKFQCAARESFLFGERIFDVSGVRDALDRIHLVTVDAYARNLNPARLGDRMAILLTLEEWGRGSARFCYRVIDANGRPICAGFQTLLCADAKTGTPIPLPGPLWEAMERLREIEEPKALESFRDRVLAGGYNCDSLFRDVERETAIQFLRERYPSPQVISPADPVASDDDDTGERGAAGSSPEREQLEVWVFCGQGAFDAHLLSERIVAYTGVTPSARKELDECAAIAGGLVDGDAFALVSGSSEQCVKAVKAAPELAQVGIHVQNVLGALLRQSDGHVASILMGHSFGEIAALGVGGCFDLATGIRIVCERVRAIASQAPPGGGLLAVSTDRATVATEAALLGLDQVVIAGRNHEKQTVMSGPRDQLDRLREYLRFGNTDADFIPSPTSFHHSHLRPAAMAWLKQLRALPIKAPSLNVYSPIERRFISPDDDIAAIIVSQFLRPFDLQGAISDVVAAGATRFVDCGSSGPLARLISKAAAPPIEVCSVEHAAAGLKSRAAVDSLTASTESRPLDQAATRSNGKTLSNEEGRPEDGTNVRKRVAPTTVIVGQGCILPGGACSPEQLYAAIMEQRSGIVDQRDFDPYWSGDFYSEKLAPDRSTSHLAGRVNDADIVAPAGVDPEVFDAFSRAQRLLCIALAPCIASLKEADRVLCLIGATADGFEDQDVVSSLRFAGIDPTDQEIGERMTIPRSAFQEPHDAVQEVFDRVVRPGLKVILLDAACASSLYTVALGMRSLESGEADVVVAGGVFCPGPGNSCLFSQFHGTTATGCRPFDANADGVVFSEGAAVVTMRRLSDAERLGLPISAALRGAGLSSDGRSSSANVPQTHGQLLSLERCYVNYNIDAGSIQAIEAHGTSTSVGDATELETLRRFFKRRSKAIPLHSLKGLLGHAGWAAGTASVIAACEYMRNGVFPSQACHHEPSEALVRARGTLVVAKQSLSLPSRQCRVAIDGFGFGGANAHLVLDRYFPNEPYENDSQKAGSPATETDDDLVFVAYREVLPTRSTTGGLRFDRERVTPPEGHVLLPDLMDDMDISQKLAILLVDGIVAQIPQFDNTLRRETAVVLAQSGKTERGVEATLRVLAPRFRRRLAGLDRSLEKLAAAHSRARPSGPYTLQCMMPNVSAGRAALQLNLNGPNFVVDAGSNSLEAAMESAAKLLRGGEGNGTRLVIVGAIDANPWSGLRSGAQASGSEFAAAFAVTTRRYAAQLGLSVLIAVEGPLRKSCGQAGTEKPGRTTAQKVCALLNALDAATNVNANRALSGADANNMSTEPGFAIYHPVWVEAPPSTQRPDAENLRTSAVVAISPPDRDQIAVLAETLASYTLRSLVVVLGPTAAEPPFAASDVNITSVDLADADHTASVLSQIHEFRADVIVAVESITSWSLSESLTKVATDNRLCEFLFLVAQRNASKLMQGTLELWGVFLNGWNGVVHPASGPVAGLLKAVGREFAAARIGVVCTRGVSLGDAFERLLFERLQRSGEQELVFDGAVRLVRRLRRSSRATEAVPQISLHAGSVVLATGGARGVTAVLVEALLRDHQCTVVALGRSSPEPGPTNPHDADTERKFYTRFLRDHPNASAAEMKSEFEIARSRWEVHESIEQLSTLGQFKYMVADVTDDKEVASVIQKIADKYGRIDLIVHGAGVQFSKRLEHRSLAEFQKTFSVKVSGLRNLTDHCRTQFGGTISTHVLTSAYSLFGNDGQHDYGAANETLDRLCGLSRIQDEGGWSSIAWLAWDGIGMTRGNEYRTLAKQRGLSGLSAEDGQCVFREVLSGRTQSATNVPLSEAEHVQYQVMTIPPPPAGSTGRVIELRIELSKIDCLAHHKVRGAPTLPGAWILEHMVKAGLQLCKDAALVTSAIIEDIVFHRFVRASGQHEPNIRTVAEQTARGIVVWMVGDILHSNGTVLSKDVIFSQATLSFEREANELQPLLQVNGLQHVQGRNRRVTDPYCDGRCKEVELTGPFDCVRDIEVGPAGRRARFVPTVAHGCSGVIPAMLLDSAWRVGAMYADPENDELYVPVRIQRVVVPVGSNAGITSASMLEIRSTAPKVDSGIAHWNRTEVYNKLGVVQLVVEDASASRLH